MKSAPIVLILLAFASAALASDCVSCEQMADRPQARILTINDDVAYTLEMYTYYENLSATPSRQPINNTIVIIELTNSTGLKEIYKTYVNSNGSSRFNFNTWKNGCITFKVLYCPFCNPDSPECGFDACMNFSLIGTDKHSAAELDTAPGSFAESLPASTELYLPALDQLTYCPPPPSMAATPSLCLPILIIFSLLSGALYLTGRNPWAGFNIGGARIGKHIRYQARGRGFSLDLKSLAMSISSAKGETEIDESTGKRKGESTEPKWFGYSMVRDLKDVVVGTKGAGGSGSATQVSKDLALGGGRRARPGIAGAFRQAGRDGRASTARVFGGQVDSKGKAVGPGSGQAAGRAFGAGEIARQWGNEVLISLGRIGATLYDSSFFSSLLGTFDSSLRNLSSRLESTRFVSERQNAAMLIADAERLSEVAGREYAPGIAQLREGSGQVDEDGSRTGRSGSRYIEISSEGLGLPAGATVVATVGTIGPNGESTITVHVGTGSGEGRILTNYTMQNGTVVGLERVMNVGSPTGEQMGINFRMGPNGRLEASGITSYSNTPGQPPERMEVRRDDQGLIIEVGNITVQRNDRGEVTAMFDRNLPASQSGQPGLQVPTGTTLHEAVTNLISNDGNNINQMQGIIAINAANMKEMASRTMETANASLERTSQMYMAQYGMVEVTDHNVLKVSGEGERGSDGTIRSDGRGDMTIRVIDSDYTPSGQPGNRSGLANGTTIELRNDAYISATDASGRNILQRDQEVHVGDRTMYQTSLTGTNIVLDTNTSRGQTIEATNVIEHVGEVNRLAGDLRQSFQAYQTSMLLEAGRQFGEQRPGLAAAFESATTDRRQGGEALSAHLRESGVPDDVAAAAGLLYGSTTIGYRETSFAADAHRGAEEYSRAFSTAIMTGDHRVDQSDLAAMSPRARAYMEARDTVQAEFEQRNPGSHFNPDDPQVSRMIEVRMRPAVETIRSAETQAISQAQSRDPAIRQQGEDAIRALGMVPRDYQLPEGTTLWQAAADRRESNYRSEMGDVVGDRLRGNTGAVMASHPELIVAGDETQLGRSVATTMLGLGPQLAGMSDTDVRMRVQEHVNSDPSISPEDRANASRYVDRYLDGARNVARDFGRAETLVSREVVSNQTSFMPSSHDQTFERLLGEQYVAGRPEFQQRPVPPQDSSEAREFMERTGTSPDQLTQRWDDSEYRRVQAQQNNLVVDASREWGAAMGEARRSLPPDASSADLRDYAMGRMLTNYASQAAMPDGSVGPNNPMALNAHQTYLGMVAGGPSDSNSRALNVLNTGWSGDLSSPDYAPPEPLREGSHVRGAVFDPMALSAFAVGTRTVLLASEAYGNDVPQEVYAGGTRAISEYNRGNHADASRRFLSSSTAASSFIEERRQREMEEAGDSLSGR
ncbi:hypothetical protein L0Y65_03480 [Candidatus Micrarchaeota archaeon]|nr:hypothetical protein [Candidatus Micrarchaeota archaeon]